jgi:hypothetical protein
MKGPLVFLAMLLAGASVLFFFSGALVYWQIASQPSKSYCLPFCAGGSLPVYIYADAGLTLLMLGLLSMFLAMVAAVLGLRMLRAKK